MAFSRNCHPERAVLVVSPGGEVVRQIKFAKPDPAAVAISLNVADRLVSIELGDKPEPGKLVNPKYLVLNSATGKEFGYFLSAGRDQGKVRLLP